MDYVQNIKVNFNFKFLLKLQKIILKFRKIQLTKYEKTFREENYKVLLKEIKEDLSKWRDMLHSWIGWPLVMIPKPEIS